MAELEGPFRPRLAQFPHLGGETEVLSLKVSRRQDRNAEITEF